MQTTRIGSIFRHSDKKPVEYIDGELDFSPMKEGRELFSRKYDDGYIEHEWVKIEIVKQ